MTDSLATLPETLFTTAAPWILLMRELPWFTIIVQLLLCLVGALVLHRTATALLMRLTSALPYSQRMVIYGHRAAGMAVFLLSMHVVMRSAPDALSGVEFVRQVTALTLIMTLTWLSVRIVRAIAATIIDLNPADAPDNLHARRIQTQTKVLAQATTAMIVLIGSGAALMTLPLLRQIGTSLLASAGVAGLVVGFAAKPVLGNLLAGIQLALTQPIRLQDVVIVENEWGWIEEITGTYVVIRIWDQRRLVVPLQWFIEHPFQNWTRNNAEILGTVQLWVDYRLPMDPIRQEAQRLCETAPEWDGRVCVTQVVDANERAMQIRVLVSAADAGLAWELRCRVREGLIGFLHRCYPQYLPQSRVELRTAVDPIPASASDQMETMRREKQARSRPV